MNLLIPVSWLREYLKTDVATKTLANLMSLAGPSVERMEKKGEDYVFDVEVTTNRPDAFSIFGLAREADAILTNENHKSKLVEPVGLNTKLDPDTQVKLPIDVLIKNKSLCPRFTAIVLDNVSIKPSPAFIKNRLEAVGIRSINNIVDISNYIMMELGQPMHTFDYDKIKGAKMTMRESQEGEKVTTLDNQVRQLPKDTIVIEDGEGRLIDLCGIMGGANSQISTRTKRVVMFVQAYDPIRIRKTTQALAFRTDAAARFEKGVDLEGILPALSRSVHLAKKTAGAKIASELVDIVNQKTEKHPISLNLEKLYVYLGTEIPKLQAEKILTSLGLKVESTNTTITATPPSWRATDITIEEDLIEEIARIYGYHRLPSKLPQGEIPLSTESDLFKVIELKKALKYLGLTEIISYSIISNELLALAGVKEDDAVELTNPLSSDWQFMRPTLIPSFAAVIAKNQTIKNDLKIFEAAKTYIKRENDLPTQDLMLTIAFQNSDFNNIKGLTENVLEILRRETRWQKLGKSSPLFEKEQSANVLIGDKIAGTVGILNANISQNLNIKGKTAIAELNLTTIYELPSTQLSFHPIPKFPPIIEDISAIFNNQILMANIIDEIKKSGSPLVKKVEVLDVFENEKIGAGRKSVTLRLTYQRSDSTPTQEEVTQKREEIINNLTKYLHAQIRA